MAGKVKFPLKMADGAVVRDPEELREHFDLASVLGYYDDGRLAVWLENCYYDDEARQVRALDSSDPDFNQKLFEILGIQSATSITDMVSMSKARENNRRLNELRKYTGDDTILAAPDRVAFTQEEMLCQVRAGWKEIYLFGELFCITADAHDVTFIGINRPKVRLLDRLAWKGLQFQNVDFLIKELIQQADAADDPASSVSLLSIAAEAGEAEAQYKLALCYKKETGVVSSPADAFKWMQKAAQQGRTEAQRDLGHFYYNGYATEKNYELAAQWYQKAAESGDLDAQNMIGNCYNLGRGVPQSYETAIKWYLKAAEQGYDWAQYNLADFYYRGHGVAQDSDEAFKWYKKAAEQGIAVAWYELWRLYGSENQNEALEWLRKAAEQGHREAQYEWGYYLEHRGSYADDFTRDVFPWYLKAAQQGHAQAQCIVAWFYR